MDKPTKQPTPEPNLEAIYRCVEVGSFSARAWPKGVDEAIEASLRSASRRAEQRLRDDDAR